MKSFNYKKSLGQNFLKDKNIIKKISDNINPNENDLIVEIGPGAGALTKELVKKNCDIICFEIDERLKEILEAIDSDRINIVFKDFLKVNLSEYIDREKYNHIYFVGNLPYYITTAIINKIISESDPYEIIIMVQKEVGERFSSKPNSKNYNSLSVFLQYNFDIKKIVNVSKQSFIPMPKVDSMVIKLKKNKKYIVNDEEYFYRFVKDSFAQKRKNLKNNLKNYDLNKLDRILKSLGKDLTYRAEALSVVEFVNIVNELK
ncbi:MAG: 16S rRNA (adenine(1518)-N(6)/adenine(1519)-N(6))-dimethyltransferase RsmA [bacterium]|nr:16S rRNA (adenine(1518)-N(6)/adenine(1519)-N(6))-dimethyltransferase RsmA [bacterium]